jgi:3-oxoacyl-[acyl-carrier-protein] synthase-3
VTKVLRSVVTGVGGYLPDEIVTNHDLAKIVDTTDEWIVERTGIRQRRRAAPDQAVSDLATAAAERALKAAGRTAADVDLIIVATTTPDLTFPATATIVQRKLGAPIGIAFDVQAVCSGFVYALSVADGFVARGRARCALVIGAETMTRLMDWTDRGTCVLCADGNKQDLLYVDGGVSTDGKVGHLRMQGNQVFRHAVVNISDAVRQAAADAGVEISEVDWFIPHQANQRILEGVARRLGIDESKVISTVAEHANTSAASIPLALDQGLRDGRIQPGQLLLLEAMGGGLTWGACVVRL